MCNLFDTMSFSAIVAGMDQEARVEVCSLKTELLTQQLMGYSELSSAYPMALNDDASVRQQEIEWAQRLCDDVKKDFERVVRKTKEDYPRIIEKQLIRRHNTKVIQKEMEEARRMRVEETSRIDKEKESMRADYQESVQALQR